jgi:transposase InsO family protein
MTVSMSRKGKRWDNSLKESFCGSLKSEWLSSCRFVTGKAARLKVIVYLSNYDSLRLRSTLGHVSSMKLKKE